VDILSNLAGGAIGVIGIIAICTLIEMAAPVERYSLRSRMPGLAMNIVQKPLTLLAAWPLNQLWHFADWVEAGSHEEALAEARKLRPDANKCEVWLKDRLIAQLNSSGEFQRAL
jgi:hypothetical protein